LIAPVIAPKEGEKDPGGRTVYLPAGTWYDFWTEEKYEGQREYEIKSDRIPVFVKAGSLVPLAWETDAPGGDSVFSLELLAYGEKTKPFMLIEDDGVSFDYQKGVCKCWTVSDTTCAEDLAGSARYKIRETRRIS